ncbi:HTH-like domain-containing protein [Clostridium butyricum]|uniref:HTH-like domain-containing protein n=1 Tax=Clostridium butyricum TaxID=1492 RepID=UPI00374FC84F
MTEVELGKELRRMYEKGVATKEQTTMIHLFAIKYAEEIRKNKYIPRNILKCAEMAESYQVEINKGIKLDKYVEVK